MKVELIGRSVGFPGAGDGAGAVLCGIAAATCTDYPDPMKALSGAMGCGHESVAEHASYTFRITGVSRVLLAQLTRHRLMSFAVQSQRYCRVDKCEFVTPLSIEASKHRDKFINACVDAYAVYHDLIMEGVPDEDARYVLPQGVLCNLVLTANARELRHFFELRCCNRAQWEIRDLADRMLNIVSKFDPDLFKLAGPGCVRGRCPEGKRSCGAPRTEMHVKNVKK